MMMTSNGSFGIRGDVQNLVNRIDQRRLRILDRAAIPKASVTRKGSFLEGKKSLRC